MQKERGGFTLIELLVVIAIIALLMSILMPALARVKLQAQAAVDQSNQHQFSLIWKYYTDENNGLFGTRPEMMDWPVFMADFMGGADRRIWFCPAATKLYIEGGRWPYAAWSSDERDEGGKIIAGSYTVNLWTAVTRDMGVSRDPDKFWQTPYAKGCASAPLLMDGNWGNTEPEPDDEPPPFDGFGMQPNANEMKRVCINRHNYQVQASFLDLSAKSTKLKQLWKLKWHKKWPTNAFPNGGWTPWMMHLSD
jgi:prepilin-type N-terminal cleavage/methylation domain-containing protein